jgi:ABC-type spermidine/putrescine transport system permease subunit II
VLTLVFILAPLVQVVVNSVNADPALARWAGATSRWFRGAYEDEDVRAAVGQSLRVAFATTALSLVIAVPAALWWRGATRRGRRWFDVLVLSRIVLPEVVFATALFLVFAKLGMPLGLSATVVGHTVWGSALATVVLQARVQLLDGRLEQAAADLGATPARVFRRVTLPGLMPGVIAAAILTFTLSFDDVVTSSFLGGGAQQTLPIVLLAMIRFSVTPEVNAIGAAILVVSLGLVVLAGALVFRVTSRKRTGLA